MIDSILIHELIVGINATNEKAIVDKDAEVPPGTRIGVIPAEDRQRGFTVTDGGVTVIPKGERISKVRLKAEVRQWHVKNQISHEKT